MSSKLGGPSWVSTLYLYPDPTTTITSHRDCISNLVYFYIKPPCRFNVTALQQRRPKNKSQTNLAYVQCFKKKTSIYSPNSMSTSL